MRALALAVLLLLVAGAGPAGAGGEPSLRVAPTIVRADAAVIVTGRNWPVNEFCRRRVRLALESDQNAVPIETVRVRRSGRFALGWVPEQPNAVPGRWRVGARMRYKNGKDGSPVTIRRRAALQIR